MIKPFCGVGWNSDVSDEGVLRKKHLAPTTTSNKPHNSTKNSHNSARISSRNSFSYIINVFCEKTFRVMK